MDNTEALLLRLLQGIKVFSGFSHHNVKELLSAAVRVDVEAGSYALVEGETSREFYIVISGEFAVVKKLSSGKEKVIARLRPGDSFGEMSYLDGRPRSASVIADTDSVLISFERAKLLKIPESAALIYLNLANLMAVRVRDSNSLISLALEKHEGGVTSEGVPPDALKTHHRFQFLRAKK